MNKTPQDGIQQDYTTSNLMIENNDLKKRIFMLEQEKIELQQAVSQNQMSTDLYAGKKQSSSGM